MLRVKKRSNREAEREALLYLFILLFCVTPATSNVAMVLSQVAEMWQLTTQTNKQENLLVTFHVFQPPCSLSCVLFVLLISAHALSNKRGGDA